MPIFLSPAIKASQPGREPWLQFLVCCFAAILGFRMLLITHFGASVPMVDEWRATGWGTLAAWSNGSLSMAALFEAHNGDHRIVATRLWEIIWFTVNGAWDPKLLMHAKAVIYSGAAVIFIHLLTAGVGRLRFAAAGVLSMLFALPFGYQNLLWAFQSQFDFFLLASALGWLALIRGRSLAALWIALGALFTVGIGPVLAASYLPYLAVAIWRGMYSFRKGMSLIFAAGVIAIFGASLRTDKAAPLLPPAAQAETFGKLVAWPACTVHSYVFRLPETAALFPRKILEFPQPERSWLLQMARWLQANPWAITLMDALLGALMLAPIVLMAAQTWRRRLGWNQVVGPLCMANFALLLMAGTAIARADQATVGARYLDLVVLVGFSAMMACLILARQGRIGRRIAILWLAVFIPSYTVTLAGTFVKMNQRLPERWLANLQPYFPSRDHSMLADNSSAHWPIMDKDPRPFMAMLDHPAMQPVLPLSLTAPDQMPPWPSRLANLLGRNGWLLALIAGGCAARIAWGCVRRAGDLVACRGGPVRADLATGVSTG